MDSIQLIKKVGYISTIVVFVFGFFLFYGYTKEPIGSFFAALLSAILVLGSSIIIRWVAEIFK